jgi:antiphage defense system Thoeris ThsB-like protein
MSYRNKTYVIFDGDLDMWAYVYMKGWKVNPDCEFDFHDAHNLKPLSDWASSEDYIKDRLRARFSSAKQVIVLIGDKTKNLYRFVRWELEVALDLDLPIIAVNLNGKRQYDAELCPPILRGEYVLHVPFKMAVIKLALDYFPREHARRPWNAAGDRSFTPNFYSRLGL